MNDNNDRDRDGLDGQGQPAPAGEPRKTTQAEQERHGKGVSIWFVVGLLLSIGAVGYIIFDGAEDAVFAYTVDQAVEQKGDLEGKKFRVRGLVMDGTVKATPGKLDSQFDLVKNEKIITVTYDKPLPDTFKPGIEVIAEGEMDDNGRLKAENVIAKCPSKYEEGAPTAKGMKKPPHPPGGPQGGPQGGSGPGY